MQRRGMTAVLLAVTMLAGFVAGCAFGAADEDQLLGRWRVQSFNGVAPLVDVNTASGR